MKQYENLSLKGGGVVGIAYAGSLKVMEENNLIKPLKRCSGTSAGAICAALISIGYTSDQIYTLLKNTNFNDFTDGYNPFRLLTKYGLYKGDAFLKWLQKCLTDKNLPKDLTFSQLSALTKSLPETYKELYVFAANLNTLNVDGFSVDRTPDVKIADAVRASMSIPFFFKSFKIKGYSNDIYVDGGISYNYPISVFDNAQFLDGVNDGVNEKTIGFYLGLPLKKSTGGNDLDYNHPKKYILDLFSTLMQTETINFKRREQDVARTVFIDTLGISATNFDITLEQKIELYNSGYSSTSEYLKSI